MKGLPNDLPRSMKRSVVERRRRSDQPSAAQRLQHVEWAGDEQSVYPHPQKTVESAAEAFLNGGVSRQVLDALSTAPPIARASFAANLQGSSGNAAVAQLMRTKESATVQRETAPEPAPTAGGETVTLPPGFSLNLVEAQLKEELRRVTGGRLRDARVAYAEATKNIGKELAEKAKKNPPLILTLFDLLIGALAPGIIGVITSQAVKQKLSDVASKAIRATLTGKSPNIKGITPKAKPLGTVDFEQVVDLRVKADELIDKVISGGTISAGFKKVTDPVRSSFAPKFASNAYVECKEEILLERMREDFRDAMDALDGRLIGMETIEVMSLHLAYAPENTREGIYRAAIRDTLEKHEVITKAVEGQFDRKYEQIVRLSAWGRVGLAILHENPGSLAAFKRATYSFVKWIEPEMEPFAEEQAKKDWRGGIPIFDASSGEFMGCPFVGHIDAPETEGALVAEVEMGTGSKPLAVVKLSAGRYELLNWVRPGDGDYARLRADKQPKGMVKIKYNDLAAKTEKYSDEGHTKWW